MTNSRPPIQQRDVYLLPHTHQENVEDHLFIVLSSQESNEYEGTFLAVMITTSLQHYDDFSFDLSDEMFEKPLRKENSHVRMHLIALNVSERHIKSGPTKLNRMKSFYFNQLMKQIGELVFNFKFSPIS